MQGTSSSGLAHSPFSATAQPEPPATPEPLLQQPPQSPPIQLPTSEASSGATAASLDQCVPKTVTQEMLTKAKATLANTKNEVLRDTTWRQAQHIVNNRFSLDIVCQKVISEFMTKTTSSDEKDAFRILFRPICEAFAKYVENPDAPEGVKVIVDGEETDMMVKVRGKNLLVLNLVPEKNQATPAERRLIALVMGINEFLATYQKWSPSVPAPHPLQVQPQPQPQPQPPKTSFAVQKPQAPFPPSNALKSNSNSAQSSSPPGFLSGVVDLFTSSFGSKQTPVKSSGNQQPASKSPSLPMPQKPQQDQRHPNLTPTYQPPPSVPATLKLPVFPSNLKKGTEFQDIDKNLQELIKELAVINDMSKKFGNAAVQYRWEVSTVFGFLHDLPRQFIQKDSSSVDYSVRKAFYDQCVAWLAHWDATPQ